MAIEKLRYIVTADTKGFNVNMKAVGALVVATFALAIKVSADFEKQLSSLRGISGATADDMKALEDKARDLGKSTAFTATEVAKLQTELAKLGYSTNDILNASGGVLDLAAGLEVSLAEAAALTGNVLNQFGLDASETGRVVDVLGKSTTISALDFTKLQESMKVAGPAAASLNIGLEETVAILAALADVGLGGSIGGTAFKKFVSSAAKSGRTISSIFDEIVNSADPAAASIRLLGDRTFGAGVALAKTQGKIEEFTAALKDAFGSTSDLRKIKEDNLTGDVDKLKSALSEVAIVLGGSTNPKLREFVKLLTQIVNDFDSEGFLSNVITGFEDLYIWAQNNRKLGIGIQQFFHSFSGFESQKLVEELDEIDAALKRIYDRRNSLGGNQTPLSEEASKFKSIFDDGDGAFNTGKKKKKKIITRTDPNKAHLDALKELEAANRLYGLSEFGLIEATREKKKMVAQETIKDKKTLNDTLIAIDEKYDNEQEVLSADGLKKTKERNAREVKLKQAANAKILSEVERLESDLGNLSLKYIDVGADKEAQKITAEIDRLKAAMADGTITLQMYKDALKGLKSDFEAIDPAIIKAQQAVSSLEDSLNSAIAGVLTDFGKAIGDAFNSKDEDFDFGDAVLDSIGKFLVSMGTALIAYGTLMGLFIALGSNPISWPVAIGVGIAAVAVGTALSNAAQKGPFKESSRGSGASASSAGTFTPTSTQGAGSGVEIVGVLRGQDLVLQLQAANRIRPGLT